MERYEVFYRDTLIGRLTVDTTANRYRYDPDAEGVAKVESAAFLLKVMKEGSRGFGEPIPFFQSRIYYMKQWKLTEINYQTDFYTLRLLPTDEETNP